MLRDCRIFSGGGYGRQRLWPLVTVLYFLKGLRERVRNEVAVAGLPGRVSNCDTADKKQDRQQLGKEVR
jgi:hypothetical protein